VTKPIYNALEIPIHKVAEALGLKVNEKENKYYCACPFTRHEHDNTDPRCELGGKRNIVKCWKCGTAKDNLGLVMQVLKYNPKEAGDWLRKTFGLANDMPATSPSPIAQLAIIRDWSLDAFEILGCKEDAENGNVIIPMRDAKGIETGQKLRRGDGKKFNFGDHPKSYTPKGGKAGLFYPLDGLVNTEECILVVEGEADTLSALSAGFRNVVGTAGSSPGEMGEESLQFLLAGRKCVLFPDPGASGRKWLEKVGRLLANAQCDVWYAPASSKDLDARIAGVPDRRLAVKLMLEKALKWVNAREGMPENPPIIYTNDILLSVITRDCINALHAKNNPPVLFVRDGQLVKIYKTEKNIIKISEMARANMRLLLSHAAYFIYVTAKGDSYKAPSNDIVDSVLSEKECPFPPLEAVTAAPILRKDGTICREPGYDVATKIFYWPPDNLGFPLIPEKPTREEAIAARDLLLDVIADFPFKNDASKANTLALLFTMVMRQIIDGSIPLAIIESPVQGTGKSKLINNLATIAFGQFTTITAPTGREEDEEWRKLITSTLRDGPSVVIIDNFRERDVLMAAPLAQLLTQQSDWSARELGKVSNVNVENRAVWVATGNNIKIGGDITRRTYSIRIDANTERPWERDPDTFRHKNLEKYVKENRIALLAAAFTVVRYWFSTGKPVPEDIPIIGSFEEWAENIAGILHSIEIHGFLMNRGESIEAQDEESSQWAAFFDAWYDFYGEREVQASEVAADLIMDVSEFSKTPLPDSISAAKDKGKGSLSRSLGKRLSTYTERIFGGKKLTYKIDSHDKLKTYKLVFFEKKAPGDRESVQNLYS